MFANTSPVVLNQSLYSNGPGCCDGKGCAGSCKFQEAFEVITESTDLVTVRTALQDAEIDYESAESSFVPSVTVPLDEDGARKVFKVIDALEDCDDVQNVYANFDVSDDVMALIDA